MAFRLAAAALDIKDGNANLDSEYNKIRPPAIIRAPHGYLPPTNYLTLPCYPGKETGQRQRPVRRTRPIWRRGGVLCGTSIFPLPHIARYLAGGRVWRGDLERWPLLWYVWECEARVIRVFRGRGPQGNLSWRMVPCWLHDFVSCVCTSLHDLMGIIGLRI